MLRAQVAHNNLFFRLFPPPRYLAMPAVGLDITDDIIRCAELKATRHGLALGLFGEVAVPTGAIEEGFIKSKDSVVRVLTAFRKKSNRLPPPWNTSTRKRGSEFSRKSITR